MRRVWKYRVLLLMLLPGIVYFFINNYLPIFGVIIAFKNINYTDGILGSPWVGFSNFEYLFKTEDAWIITRNTILYNAAFIAVNVFVAATVAIMLNEIRNRYMQRLYQSVILLPFMLSMVIVGYLAYSFLSIEYGFLNRWVLAPLGIDYISWYSEPKYWPFILIAVNTWKNVGYYSVIYLAAIAGIDHEYYEAARIDGAGKLKQVMHITFPLLMPVIVIMTLLQIGRIMYADFGLFFQVPLNSGALMSTTNVIDTYVYRALLQMGDIGMASAAGLYQSLIGFVLVFGSNYIVRKLNRENALF